MARSRFFGREAISLLVVTILYLAVNAAYVRGLGLAGLAASTAAAADLLERGFGTRGAQLMSAMVSIAALTSINATILVGAR